MEGHKARSKQRAAQPRAAGELKDEVYRQMFLLEERRPGAEMDLAVALLRAWQAAGAKLVRSGDRAWLKKICPICLAMIEAAGRRGAEARSSASNDAAAPTNNAAWGL